MDIDQILQQFENLTYHNDSAIEQIGKLSTLSEVSPESLDSLFSKIKEMQFIIEKHLFVQSSPFAYGLTQEKYHRKNSLCIHSVKSAASRNFAKNDYPDLDASRTSPAILKRVSKIKSEAIAGLNPKLEGSFSAEDVSHKEIKTPHDLVRYMHHVASEMLFDPNGHHWEISRNSRYSKSKTDKMNSSGNSSDKRGCRNKSSRCSGSIIDNYNSRGSNNSNSSNYGNSSNVRQSDSDKNHNSIDTGSKYFCHEGGGMRIKLLLYGSGNAAGYAESSPFIKRFTQICDSGKFKEKCSEMDNFLALAREDKLSIQMNLGCHFATLQLSGKGIYQMDFKYTDTTSYCSSKFRTDVTEDILKHLGYDVSRNKNIICVHSKYKAEDINEALSGFESILRLSVALKDVDNRTIEKTQGREAECRDAFLKGVINLCDYLEKTPHPDKKKDSKQKQQAAEQKQKAECAGISSTLESKIAEPIAESEKHSQSGQINEPAKGIMKIINHTKNYINNYIQNFTKNYIKPYATLRNIIAGTACAALGTATIILADTYISPCYKQNAKPAIKTEAKIETKIKASIEDKTYSGTEKKADGKEDEKAERKSGGKAGSGIETKIYKKTESKKENDFYCWDPIIKGCISPLIPGPYMDNSLSQYYSLYTIKNQKK